MYADLLPMLLGLLVATLQKAPDSLPVYRVVPARSSADELLDPATAGWSSAERARWGTPPYATTFCALRDEDGLWVRFDADDDAPWHTHTERDAPLWEEEVVEIFLDPDGDGHDYAELEISPAGTVTDLVVFDGWPQMRSDIGWDLAGLRSRVTRGSGGDWTAIAHIPWTALAALPGPGAKLPPEPGDRWRFNVFRIKRPGGPQRPHDDVVLAAWSPVPGPSFHVPDRFAWMEFADR